MIFCDLSENFDATYQILESDSTYAVVFACSSLSKLINGQMVWILSRTPEMSSNDLNKAIELLKRQEISTTQLIESDQANCEAPNQENEQTVSP